MFGRDRDDVERLIEPLQLQRATLDEPDTVDAPGEVDDLPTGEDFACFRAGLEPASDVQGSAAKAPLDGHGLTGVESDPHGEREGWIGGRFLNEALLQGDGGSDRRAWRIEDG